MSVKIGMLSIHVLRFCHTVQYIFLATCNAILLLIDVKLANTLFHQSLLRVELRTLQAARKIAPCDRALLAHDVVLNHIVELLL